MDQRIATLQPMLDSMTDVLNELTPDEAELPTPCPSMNVEQMAEHLAVWVQVFDGAVNDTPLTIDPTTHVVGPDRAAVFAASAGSIMDGLRRRGHDRMMTMTADPMPGEFILNMLLMEYVGHGWDLAQATDRPVRFTTEQAEVALTAAQAIILPEYRGTGMFDAEVTPPPDAAPIDRLAAFLGRDPGWSRRR
ncbi:MAG: TIGR03086 family metal-binding protein [Actinomycetota bacterium]